MGNRSLSLRQQCPIKTNTFSFAGLGLRSVTIGGKPWFIATDVCKHAGLSNTTMAVRPLKDDQKGTINRIEVGMGRGPTLNIVSESGLYALVMRSDKPQAHEFQNWVTGTVLPAIRQTGKYIQGEEKLLTGEMTEEQFFATPPLSAPSPSPSASSTMRLAFWTPPWQRNSEWLNHVRSDRTSSSRTVRNSKRSVPFGWKASKPADGLPTPTTSTANRPSWSASSQRPRRPKQCALPASTR